MDSCSHFTEGDVEDLRCQRMGPRSLCPQGSLWEMVAALLDVQQGELPRTPEPQGEEIRLRLTARPWRGGERQWDEQELIYCDCVVMFRLLSCWAAHPHRGQVHQLHCPASVSPFGLCMG